EVLEKTKAQKRRAVLARLLQLEPDTTIELLRLAKEAGVTPPTVRKLARLNLIALQTRADLPGLATDRPADQPLQPPTQLNEDQQRAFDDVLPRLVTPDGSPAGAKPGFSVNLLLGVTGSGKTEVYLQCLRKVVDQGRQAIVLVPEIALTPQTVRRFTARFERVAVLHSGLSQTQRHRYWQQIATGEAQVVVGARSAVFAPVPNLGVIVVDEEHEASYKQDQAPRYHGRDVAVKRGQMEDVPVLLGSATPSLEMYAKVREASKEGGMKIAGGGTRPMAMAPAFQSASRTPQSAIAPAPSPYHLLSLPRRVRGLSLPHVELIDMKQEARFRRGVNLFSQRLEYLLTNTVAQGQQAILLLNRRGYSNYVFCPSCQEVMGCKYCDKTLTYHRSAGPHELSAKISASTHTGQLHCHYCLAVNVLPTSCPKCKKHLSLFGLGTQRVEEEIQKKFPQIVFARVDSDTMRSSKDYEALLARFARKEVQVMLGTQMIAKGLDYPNVTLVGVISGDTALALPDFRAAERTFQLITQVAGRAGRGDLPGRVVLQTFLPDDPAIQYAIKQDFVGFAEHELRNRREIGLPPFGRMVRIIIRETDDARVQEMAEELATAMSDAVAAERGAVQMKGPMPCAVGRISGYFRYQILLSSPTPAPLQRVLAAVRATGGLKRQERVAVDVDPVSLL
ncbi:MAG TPA: primosomal protein N', partial [Humisphaera sp.]